MKINGQRSLLFFDSVGSFGPMTVKHLELAGWHVEVARGQMQAAHIDRFDTIWCDWADQQSMALLQRPWSPRVIVQTRSYEAYQSWYAQFPWKHVDTAVFVAPHIEAWALAQCPDLKAVRREIVPDGIDVDDYPLRPERDPTKAIALIGRLLEPKNVQAAVSLAWRRPDWTIHIKGPVGDQRLKNFLDYHQAKGLTNILWHPPGRPDAEGNFRGRQWFTGEGVVDLLHACDVIWSPSYHESTHLALLEGMATGCTPVVLDRAGVCVPEAFTYRTEDELSAALDEAHEFEPTKLREWVVEHRSKRVQFDAIDRVLGGIIV